MHGAAAFLASLTALSVAICPADRLPSLTIDELHDASLPLDDHWQVTFQGVPMSDLQLAQLTGNDIWIDRLRREMEPRGAMVFGGLIAAGVGTAVSSVGWALFGGIEQNTVSQTTSLSLALSGLVVGLAGVLLVTDQIQTPIEPQLAPTPRHRLSRDEVQRLVSQFNQQLHAEICGVFEPEAPAAAH